MLLSQGRWKMFSCTSPSARDRREVGDRTRSLVTRAEAEADEDDALPGAEGRPAVRRERAVEHDAVSRWMAMYETAHGLGQSYYLRALEMAAAAGDHITYCRTLRGMALQASSLGHGPKALELADSAAEAAPAAGPRLTAFLRGQQAHGAAMVKDQRQAFARLRETEDALSRADGRNDAVGGYDQAAYHFHVSHVPWELGDQAGSVRALRASNRARPTNEKQGRVHANGLLARRQMKMRHVEAAAETWNAFLDDYVTISSARGDEHFRTLRPEIAPYAGLRAVQQLDQRAAEVARLKAA
ncbi:hypothetical protein GCM10010430_25970 [Kitasatospora cystarginea]|uniref:Regulatory protein n=1 Tax=Kitasatospora cystarginea TaxID=58350 RepID=A0ABP5QVU6_9ACTN